MSRQEAIDKPAVSSRPARLAAHCRQHDGRPFRGDPAIGQQRRQMDDARSSQACCRTPPRSAPRICANGRRHGAACLVRRGCRATSCGRVHGRTDDCRHADGENRDARTRQAVRQPARRINVCAAGGCRIAPSAPLEITTASAVPRRRSNQLATARLYAQRPTSRW